MFYPQNIEIEATSGTKLKEGSVAHILMKLKLTEAEFLHPEDWEEFLSFTVQEACRLSEQDWVSFFGENHGKRAHGWIQSHEPQKKTARRVSSSQLPAEQMRRRSTLRAIDKSQLPELPAPPANI